jgi:hypothetical protein
MHTVSCYHFYLLQLQGYSRDALLFLNLAGEGVWPECPGSLSHLIPSYSFRSATMGSTPAAREAGSREANSAARQSSTIASASRTGSPG